MKKRKHTNVTKENLKIAKFLIALWGGIALFILILSQLTISPIGGEILWASFLVWCLIGFFMLLGSIIDVIYYLLDMEVPSDGIN